MRVGVPQMSQGLIESMAPVYGVASRCCDALTPSRTAYRVKLEGSESLMARFEVAQGNQ